MKIFGIVAEYNPFHNGHKFQLDMARKMGATHIISIMSPNFTQRGEPSITNKFYRSKAAVKSGVDLVIELPTCYALSSAEKFAFGAIYLFSRLKIIDYLIFGTEIEDINLLYQIVDEIESDVFNKELFKILNKGYSFPKSRQLILEKFLGVKIAGEISKPNNILAIEYIKWLRRLKSDIKPLPLKRIGVKHNEKRVLGKITSAFNLRKMIYEDDLTILNWKPYVPYAAYEIYKMAYNKKLLPASEIIGERAVLSKLRSVSIEKIRLISDVSEGIEYRIFKSIQMSSSLNEIYQYVKTKRYTMSRIRRIIYNLFLDLNFKSSKFLPQYVRILACNRRGIEIISQIKNFSNIYIDNNLLRLSMINSEIKNAVNVEINATNMYNLFCENILPCNSDLTNVFNVD